MEYSRNILVIEHLETESSMGNMGIARWDATLWARVDFYCPITNQCFRTMGLELRANAYGFEESLRRVIEKFMNKDFSIVKDHKHFGLEVRCIPSKMIHEVKINLQGRMKGLFEDLFDINWNPNILRLEGKETIKTN